MIINYKILYKNNHIYLKKNKKVKYKLKINQKKQIHF